MIAVLTCPAARRDTAYVGSADGVVYAIGRRGKVRWRFRTGGIVALIDVRSESAGSAALETELVLAPKHENSRRRND